ncbi:MAG: PQQ-binding-like beta-propeller repeat protein [Thermoleophilia bacterium]
MRQRSWRTSIVPIGVGVLLLTAASGAVVFEFDRARGGREVQSWVWPNGDLSSARSTPASVINATSVGRLRLAWRYRMSGKGGGFGLLTSTPLSRGDTAYVQDTASSVFAIDLRSGRRQWARRLMEPNDGPNGIALLGDRLYGATDTAVFSLDAVSGRQVWRTRLANKREQFIYIAPVVDRGRVYVSTVGFSPGGRGAIYALDAVSGKKLWRFDTIRGPWRRPEAGGGGAWEALSVDAQGLVYAGIANPGPWGGSKEFPNGGLYEGPALYTDSLVVLDGATGKLRWYDQVHRHDVRDYDFHLSPVLATVGGRDLVFGGGKGGLVVAWDRETHRRIWTQPVGKHRNDIGPLPVKPVEVCPGLFGGALTPMAYADGRVFVPVVELCMKESSVKTFSVLQRPPEDATGSIVALDAATGRTLWTRALPSAAFGCATVASDVVFAPTFDGRIYALSALTGAVLWSDRAEAGINGCPSVAGDTLLVPAGAPHRDFAELMPQLLAYRLSSVGT